MPIDRAEIMQDFFLPESHIPEINFDYWMCNEDDEFEDMMPTSEVCTSPSLEKKNEMRIVEDRTCKVVIFNIPNEKPNDEAWQLFSGRQQQKPIHSDQGCTRGKF